jgi:hypothetical protein
MGNTLWISYPLYNMPLFKAERNDDGYALVSLFGGEKFERQTNNAHEMPTYGDLMECLISSGVLPFSNIDRLLNKVSQCRLFKRCCIGLDTNVLYRRVISNTQLLSSKEVVLVDTVREEIEYSLNYKYAPNHIESMKKTATCNQHLLEELVNRRTKKSRKATRFALRELILLKNALEIESGEDSTSDSRMNDQIIARAFRRYEKENGAIIMVLTGDTAMKDVCEAEGLECFLLETPYKMPTEIDDVGPRQLRAFICDLASILGMVRINSVALFGEFKGKVDWDGIKLVYLDDWDPHAFERDMRACRRLMQLSIAP